MKNKSIVVGLLLLTAPLMALAIKEDRKAQIDLFADFAEKNDKKGITTLTGSVVISQGSLVIKADRATIHYDGEQITEINCYGKPARFQQQINPNEGLTRGHANTINYKRDSDNILLVENAHVTRADGSTMDSDTIRYGLASEQLNAEGGVHLVIPPTKEEYKKDGKNGDS